MSLAAAQAMDDLADALAEVARDMPSGTGFQIMTSLARAHRAAAAKIRARAEREIGGKALPVPPEFQAGQAGKRKGGRR
jgi:hypothetical protein